MSASETVIPFKVHYAYDEDGVQCDSSQCRDQLTIAIKFVKNSISLVVTKDQPSSSTLQGGEIMKETLTEEQYTFIEENGITIALWGTDSSQKPMEITISPTEKFTTQVNIMEGKNWNDYGKIFLSSLKTATKWEVWLSENDNPLVPSGDLPDFLTGSPNDDEENSGNSQTDKFPCASSKCWTYDKNADKCELKPNSGCFELLCGATEIEVKFDKDLFGEEASKRGFSQTTSTPCTDDYCVKCTLGSCSMLTDVHDQKLRLNLTISQAEPDMIDIGNNIKLVTTGYCQDISFLCSYPLRYEFTGDEYNLRKIAVKSSETNDGDLKTGFTMTTSIANGVITIGSMMEVDIAWAVSTLDKVTFHYEECTVTQGQNSVAVIKEMCFATALSTKPDDDNSKTKQGFSFRSFTFENAIETKQQLKCKIVLCVEGLSCDATTVTDNDCPADAGLTFKAL